MMEARFGFLACSRHDTMSGQLYRPHITRIWDWENTYFIGILLRSWPHGPQGCPMGPKFFVQNFSFIIKIRCYLMHFCHLFCKKLSLFSDFWPFSYLTKKERFRFPWVLAFFAKQITKTHKITLVVHDKRNFWVPKFWSHGTSLGSPGPLFQ